MASSVALTTTHLPRLRAILDEWRAAQPPNESFESSVQAASPKNALKDVVVAFRTRPSLPNEAAEKFQATGGSADEAEKIEFCSGITVTSAEPGVFVTHTPGMNWKGPNLAHKTFEADLAFGPAIENEEVYQRTVVTSDLLPLVLGGGVGCILAYGQTGSGKTWTMEGIEHRIARDLFTTATEFAQATFASEKKLPRDAAEVLKVTATDAFTFEVTFLELLGKVAADLVVEPTEHDERGNAIRKEVAILEDRVGNVNPSLISTEVDSSDGLEKLIVDSLSHRRVSATARNAQSSRSHALLTIRIKNKTNPYADEGQLILVDLAGSERYDDSKAHDKQRMDESRENNKSLMNLKECVRAKAKMAADDGFVHIPWRNNKLTMLLKPIFDIESRRPSRTLVIAHVSPHIQDCAHSTSTLGYAAPFKTVPPKPKGVAKFDETDPRTWSHADTRKWFAEQFAEVAGERGVPVDLDVLLPQGMLATHFGRIPTAEFVNRVVAAPKDVDSGHVWSTDEVKELAATVAGRLWHLLMTAKTRKRNAVMKSRNALDEDSHYDVAPIVPEGYNANDLGLTWTNEELFLAELYHDKAWRERLKPCNGRREYHNMQAQMILEWRNDMSMKKAHETIEESEKLKEKLAAKKAAEEETGKPVE